MISLSSIASRVLFMALASPVACSPKLNMRGAYRDSEEAGVSCEICAPAALNEPASATIARRFSLHENSLQILYEENVFSYAHNWGVYFGPQGVSVDPCNVRPFHKVYHHEGPVHPNPVISDIEVPPMTPAGEWPVASVLYDGEDCSIIGDGAGPPTLKCAQHPGLVFAKNPEYDDGTVICDFHRHHRAYYVEFTGQLRMT